MLLATQSRWRGNLALFCDGREPHEEGSDGGSTAVVILKTSLNLDQYNWMRGALTAEDDAVVTVEVTAPNHPCEISVQLVVSSAMLSVRPATEPPTTRTSDGLVVHLGAFESGEVRSFEARFFPRPASRPGRRRVAVVRAIVDGKVSDSTTVWARVERST